MPSFIKNDAESAGIVALMNYSDKTAASHRYPGLVLEKQAREDYEFIPVKLKAVDQDPPAGTLLAPGSKVIVYFEDTDSMMIDIYEGTHSGLVGREAREIVSMAKSNEDVEKILSERKDRKDLTPEEETIITTFLTTILLLDIDESDPANNVESAYKVIMASHEIMA